MKPHAMESIQVGKEWGLRGDSSWHYEIGGTTGTAFMGAAGQEAVNTAPEGPMRKPPCGFL